MPAACDRHARPPSNTPSTPHLSLPAGDIHVVRNAGGRAAEALRSIAISQQLLGTTEVGGRVQALVRVMGCGSLRLRLWLWANWLQQPPSHLKPSHPHVPSLARSLCSTIRTAGKSQAGWCAGNSTRSATTGQPRACRHVLWASRRLLTVLPFSLQHADVPKRGLEAEAGSRGGGSRLPSLSGPRTGERLGRVGAAVHLNLSQ